MQIHGIEGRQLRLSASWVPHDPSHDPTWITRNHRLGGDRRDWDLSSKALAASSRTSRCRLAIVRPRLRVVLIRSWVHTGHEVCLSRDCQSSTPYASTHCAIQRGELSSTLILNLNLISGLVPMLLLTVILFLFRSGPAQSLFYGNVCVHTSSSPASLQVLSSIGQPFFKLSLQHAAQ